MKFYSSLTLAFILQGTGASVIEPESEEKSSIRRAKILQNTLDSTEAVDMAPAVTTTRRLNQGNTDDFTWTPTITSSPTWSDDYYDVDDDDDDDNFWPTMSPTSNNCPEENTPATFSSTENDYFFNERESTWAEHAACARQWGGKLSSIDNFKEQRFIKNQLKNQIAAITGRDLRVFIGGKKLDSNWMWADGADMAYSNWATGEPQVHAKKVRVEMDFTTSAEDGKWMAVKSIELRMGIYRK